MNLIIDVGNTSVKLAIFNSGKLIFKTDFLVQDLLSEYYVVKKAYPQLKAAIVSSVGVLPKPALSKIGKDLNLHLLNHKSKVPFNNLYQTPRTLGVDRVALVSASVLRYPNKNVLIIDAGTCITYDFINSENAYLGGAISPGLRLRYESLNTFTANLPLLDKKYPEHIIGTSTESAIHSGVVHGASREVDGVIDEYKAAYQDLTVILTGGDAEFLSNQLKNSIFAHSNFLLEGLNFILEYNS